MEDTLIDIANYKGWKYINVSGQDVKNYFNSTKLGRIKLSDVLLVVDAIRTKPQSQISPQIISEIHTGSLMILKKVKKHDYAWVKENCIDASRTKIRELHTELIINGYKIDSWVEYPNLGTILSSLNGIIAKYQVNYNFPS